MIKSSKLAVVRIRGSVDMRGKALDTLRMLGLTRPNHCVLVTGSPSYKGMLHKVKDAVTWGAISPKALKTLLLKRGRLRGDKPLTDEIVSSKTPYESIAEFAEAICEEEAELSDVSKLKKVFRLHPPRKGYKSTKRSFREGGVWGNRGEKISELILRMI